MAKKNKKPLLQEGTIRRMMKLANMEALGNGFINEKWAPTPIEGQDHLESLGERDLGGEEVELEPEGDLEAELETELEPEAELDPEGEPEGEVTITDEEAQDIIDLADKLKAAVGGEEEAPEELPPEDLAPEMEMELGAEEEEEIVEEPGARSMYEEELYEAALKGLNIDVVDDQAQAKLQEVKKRVYQRVISRLLKENKK